MCMCVFCVCDSFQGTIDFDTVQGINNGGSGQLYYFVHFGPGEEAGTRGGGGWLFFLVSSALRHHFNLYHSA